MSTLFCTCEFSSVTPEDMSPKQNCFASMFIKAKDEISKKFRFAPNGECADLCGSVRKIDIINWGEK